MCHRGLWCHHSHIQSTTRWGLSRREEVVYCSHADQMCWERRAEALNCDRHCLLFTASPNCPQDAGSTPELWALTGNRTRDHSHWSRIYLVKFCLWKEIRTWIQINIDRKLYPGIICMRFVLISFVISKQNECSQTIASLLVYGNDIHPYLSQ